MKCFNHSDSDAVATCVNCGKAICRQCCISTAKGRLVCSTSCEESAQNAEESLSLVRTKTDRQNRVNGMLSALTGTAFGLFGVFTLFRSRHFLPLSILLFGMMVVLVAAGLWYLKLGKYKE